MSDNWKLKFIAEAARSFAVPFSASQVQGKLLKHKCIDMNVVGSLLPRVEGISRVEQKGARRTATYKGTWMNLKED